MATKAQVNAYAKANNVSKAEAKRHFVEQFNNPSTETIKLYDAGDLTSTGPLGARIINLPEGMQAYKDDVVNVIVYAPNSQKAHEAYMTGYGASYLSKVNTGTPRATEYIIEAALNLNTDDNWLLQITCTGNSSQQRSKTMIDRVLRSLPAATQQHFSGAVKGRHLPIGQTQIQQAGFTSSMKA